MMIVVSIAGLLLLAGCGGGEKTAQVQTSITIKGSDTMVHLVSRWAEIFMNQNSGIDISVTGGGSGTGIAALLNGTTDICAASREIKPKELELAQQKNIIPLDHIVAMDGIAVVVNPNNPVDSLTLEQLKKIFTGAYTNWNQVGGPDQSIIVLSRESSSGTYVFFQEHVLQKEDYTANARLMPATSSIIQSTEEDNWAIGYVGLGYAEDAAGKVKVLGVKENDSTMAVYPSIDTVLDGTYSIARPLHLYTNGEATGNIKKFIDFCLSMQGQEIVKETGYVPIS
jgi:phosphate transport system substrate-binding protein